MADILTVTDVTRMGGNRVCVAGYLPDGTCVRPKLESGPILDSWLWANDGAPCRPFAAVDVDLLRAASDTAAPHTEDWYVGPTYSVRRVLSPGDRQGFLLWTSEQSVRDIFGAEIQSDGVSAKRWIEPGHGTHSLGTIRAKAVSSVHFGESAFGSGYYHKLGFIDGAGMAYRLTITDLSHRAIVEAAVQKRWGTPSGIASAVRSRLQTADVWLRIGLSRPWSEADGSPERCYLQINGIYSFPDYLDGRCFADAMPRPAFIPSTPTEPGFGVNEPRAGYAMSGGPRRDAFDWDDPDDIPF